MSCPFAHHLYDSYLSNGTGSGFARYVRFEWVEKRGKIANFGVREIIIRLLHKDQVQLINHKIQEGNFFLFAKS